MAVCITVLMPDKSASQEEATIARGYNILIYRWSPSLLLLSAGRG